ncbi:hypothetical protein PQR63_20740 [Herbaspirillum rhizosphaerae]|uniref:Uncharacterized protein n=1 Tax=Herbaspirillum rhizosphaerae TaxID=346179 RepID=A0ABW8ZDA5_9BURK
MTLDIKRERRDFEAQPGIKESYDLTGFYAEGEWAYNDGKANCAFFDGWLAAKRAAVGSAEPFTYYKAPFKGWPEYSKTNEFSDGSSDGIPLYLHAPPAPVSAEPVRVWIAKYKYDLADIYDSEGNYIATMYGKEARAVVESHNKSAPPFTDTKDSELLKALEELVAVAEKVDSWESFPRAPLERAYAAIAAKGA